MDVVNFLLLLLLGSVHTVDPTGLDGLEPNYRHSDARQMKDEFQGSQALLPAYS